MDPALVKRAHRVVNTDAYTSLDPEDRLKFDHEVVKVNSFDELSKKFKRIIEAGEREIQGY